MAIEVAELFDSSGHATGDVRSAMRRYDVTGTNDAVEARLAVEAQAPTTFDTQEPGLGVLIRKSARPEPVGDGRWMVVVRYGDANPGRPPPVAGGPVTTFDTAGGTAHITHSLATVSRHGTPDHFGLAGDYRGAIGVTDDEIQGVDIVVPIYGFTETYTFDAAFISTAYRQDLFFLTGRMNNAVHGDFKAGELLFMGASGGQGANGDWDITYRFSGSPNVDDIIIGDIGTDDELSPPIKKLGWDYLWVRYQDEVDETGIITLIKRPVSVHIERVYRFGDFRLLTP